MGLAQKHNNQQNTVFREVKNLTVFTAMHDSGRNLKSGIDTEIALRRIK